MLHTARNCFETADGKDFPFGGDRRSESVECGNTHCSRHGRRVDTANRAASAFTMMYITCFTVQELSSNSSHMERYSIQSFQLVIQIPYANPADHARRHTVRYASALEPLMLVALFEVFSQSSYSCCTSCSSFCRCRSWVS